jgi:ribosomal protein S18 acetylase RimI-like enzyme
MADEHALRPMTAGDHARVCELWRLCSGPLEAAPLDVFTRFLDRNPGLSLVALDPEDGATVIGAAWCGHDGLRGAIHHIAVAPGHRLRGVGRALVTGSLQVLGAARIAQCTAAVRGANRDAMMFWRKLGWLYENDVTTLRHAVELPPETPPRPPSG